MIANYICTPFYYNETHGLQIQKEVCICNMQCICMFFQPLLSAEELHQTRSVVAEFGKAGGLGERLQQKLLERAKTHENWVSLSEISVSYLMCTVLFSCTIVTAAC